MEFQLTILYIAAISSYDKVIIRILFYVMEESSRVFRYRQPLDWIVLPGYALRQKQPKEFSHAVASNISTCNGLFKITNL